MMMKASCEAKGFGARYRRAMASMNCCRALRNQYAHCNWCDTPAEGLCFIDLEHTATLYGKITPVTKHRYTIDVPLLSSQEVYFKYVQRCFWFFAEAYRISKHTGK